MNLSFASVWEFAPSLLAGAGMTLLVTFCAAVICVVGGLLVAVISLYGYKFVSAPMRFFIWLFMGTPLLLQLYLLYFGLGQLNILMPALLIGIVGLGVHYTAYNADVFRACIQSVVGGQYEASRSLGFGHKRTLFLIVVPQAFIRALPQVGNNLIVMIKDTSVLSILGVGELLLASQYAISITYQPFEFYIAVAVIYYLLNLIMEVGLNKFERGLAHRR